MLLPDGRVSLDSDEFGLVLRAVRAFHDSYIGCGTFSDPREQTLFVEMMYFGDEYLYNPIPIIGSVFWFDLPVSPQVRDLQHLYGRAIGHVCLNKSIRTIEFSLQDSPFERFGIEFGALSGFQFVTSSALSVTPLQRR